MTDEEVEMFLDDLSENDWVFMVDGSGALKSLLVPNFEQNLDLVSEKIIKILALLDPNMEKDLKALMKEMEPKTFKELEPDSDDTLH
jgi:hypothetical protein